MPQITFDPQTKTMSALFSDDEVIVIGKVVASGGLNGLTSLFTNFLQQNQMSQLEADRIAIKNFADQATTDQRAAILAMIVKK